MAINTTRWKPDTCACVIDYEWDTTLPEANRVHTAVNVVPCPTHIGLATHQLKYDMALTHNRRKNRIYNSILDNITALRDAFVDPDSGQTYYRFKAGKSITWNLRVDGVIEVTAIGFTQTQKNTATTWISSNMPGEVVIL